MRLQLKRLQLLSPYIPLPSKLEVGLSEKGIDAGTASAQHFHGEYDHWVVDMKALTYMKVPKVGSHLVTPRAGYTHHGIYVGLEKVIHYSGLANGLSAGPIEETTLEEFSAGHGYSVIKYDKSYFGTAEILERARSRLGEDKYDLHANNCEHFCRWVITGDARSDQVDLVADVLIHNPVIGLALKTREAVTQPHGKSELVKEAGMAGAAAVATAFVPVVGQVYLLHKLVKWLRK